MIHAQGQLQDPGIRKHKTIDSEANTACPATLESMATEKPPVQMQTQKSQSSIKSQTVPKHNILYRRPLPKFCIDFASEEGKKIFKEALFSDHMNCYFRLASQFRTQDEPAYCGLATLVMVLNALEIDPGRVWKGPWKWYHEDMLDCCVSTEVVRKEGITFDDFICLAECNYLDTQAARVDQSSSEEEFRHLVKEVTQKEDTFLVVSYSRPALEQTGDGHFAPISGYHAERDLVLILDTARFKYPPYWVALSALFESMKALDVSTGLPRGYVQLWPRRAMKSLLLFKIAEQFGINANEETVESYQSFLSAWMQLLATPLPTGCNDGNSSTDSTAADKGGCNQDVQTTALLDTVLHGLGKIAQHLKPDTFVLRTQEHLSCTNACSFQCVVQDLLTQLEATATFMTVCQQILQLTSEDLVKLENVFGVWPSVAAQVRAEEKLLELKSRCSTKCGRERSSSSCNMNNTLCLCHFITAFLLSWPYTLSPTQSLPSIGCVGSALQELTQEDLSPSQRNLLSDEMSTLSYQLSKVTGYFSPSQSPRETHKCSCSSFPKFNS